MARERFHNLVEVIGLDAAEALVAAYGGVRIYVPIRSAPEGLLATLGRAATEALSHRYGGERFDVPSGRTRGPSHSRWCFTTRRAARSSTPFAIIR